ncbi:MAG: hypothetical protein K2J00_01825 [Bacteroidaceae bacterium]|nr:hypothetical protein [Bacteroidaceae bacterium]
MKKVLLLVGMIVTASVAFAQTANRFVAKKPTLDLSGLQKKTHTASSMKESLVMFDKSTKQLANVSTRAEGDEEEAKELRYLNPECTFFLDGYAYMYQPAYTKIKWQNISEGYDSYLWFFNDVYGADATSYDENLTTENSAGIGIVPQVSSGDDYYEFSFAPESGVKPYNIMYGWDPKMFGVEDRELTFVDAWEDGVTSSWVDTYCYGSASNTGVGGTSTFNQDASDDWKSYLQARYGMSMDSVINTGYAIMFPKPAAPYVLRSLTFIPFLSCEAGAELQLKLYNYTDEGYLHLFNTLTTTVDEERSLQGALVTFNMESEDEWGMIRDYLVVNEPIVAELTGFVGNDKISAIIPRVMFQNTDNYYYTGGFAATHIVTEGSASLNTFLNLPQWTYTFNADGSRKCASNWLASFDAYYPFLALYNEEGTQLVEGETVTLNASEEGETFTYYPESYEENFENWIVSGENGEELPAGVNVSMVTKEIAQGDETINVDFLEINVEPATEARTLVVNIDAGGEGVAVRKFVINQGNDSNAIGSVEESANNASVSSIYTVDGKRLAENANASVAKGVYIVKKSDGTASVVVKK